ncbi:CaiB/BaiF CoA transferase family protein [Nocardia sp. NPDC127526]|uniref:CaiB/BaiF CoA transferase family protein n=1 Tax=Nocardia sp. NPDC127526 TaxID=3345393 RepID=UPI003633F102
MRQAPSDAATPGPLDGLRVIELAGVVMGPLAGQILGDLGADVIKVETVFGDVTRQYLPRRNDDMGWLALNLNRNKRSVVLDLRSERGKHALATLLETADVLLTNLRPNSLAHLDLMPDEVTAKYPRLVYATAQGFRSGSGEENRAAYDDVIQAESGVVWLNQQMTGQPFLLPTLLADKVCGLVLAQSIMAALYYRATHGRGQHVELPMLDTMFSFGLIEHVGGAVFEPPAAAFGYSRALSPFHKAFPVKDGAVCVLPYGDRNWHDFFALLGCPDWANDPRFGTRDARAKHIDELYAMVGELTRPFTTAQLLEACTEHGIAASPVRSLDEAVATDYVRDGGLFQVAEHPTEGPYRLIGSPVRYSRTPASVRRHCPHIGEHTAEILTEIGLVATDPSNRPASSPTDSTDSTESTEGHTRR